MSIFSKILYQYKNGNYIVTIYPDGTKIRNIGIRLSNFTEHCNRQLSLFESYDEKEHKFQKTIDDIKDKFGNNMLIPASLLEKNK